MKFNKIIVLGLLTFISCSFVFAQNNEKIDVNWFSDSKVWTVNVTEEAKNYKDFSQFQLGMGATGALDMTELKVKVGMFFERDMLHEATQISYAPTINGKWNPGIVLQDHCGWSFNDYFEYDFLIGPFVEYKPNSFFKMNLAFMFQQNFSFIFALPRGKKLVYNCCPAFYLDFYFYPLEWMYINFSFSSYSFYRYYLFLSPDTKLSLNFKANDNLTLEIAAEIQSVDFFTMSANYDTLAFSTGFTWRF